MCPNRYRLLALPMLLLVCGVAFAQTDAGGAADSPEAEAGDAPTAAADAEAPSGEALETDSADGAPTEDGTPSDSDDQGEEARWIGGSFEAGIDAEWSRRDSDVDLDQTLRLQIDPPGQSRLRLRGALWLNENLGPDPERVSAVRDLNDAWDSDVRARVLSLYVEVDDLWGDSALRLGRQSIAESREWNHIDGVYFRKRLARWDWYAFGGARASIYADRHEDLVFGGGVAFRPLPRTRFAVDVLYAQESRDPYGRALHSLEFEDFIGYLFPVGQGAAWLVPNVVRVPLARGVARWLALGPVGFAGYPYGAFSDCRLDAVQASFSVWHAFGENLSVMGRVDWVDDGVAEGLLRVAGTVPKLELSYEIAYRSVLGTVEDRPSDLTGYYRVLGPWRRNENLFLAVHRPISDKLTASLEAEFQNAKASTPLAGNRDYNRFAAILTASKILKNTDAMLALELWDAEKGESSLVMSGEISRQFGQLLVAVGADYERFEDRIFRDPGLYWAQRALAIAAPGLFGFGYPIFMASDAYGIVTREDVYSLYGRATWKLDEKQDVRWLVRFQQDDGPDSPYWQFQADYTIRF